MEQVAVLLQEAVQLETASLVLHFNFFVGFFFQGWKK